MAIALALVLVPESRAQIPCGYEVTAVIQGPFCGIFGLPPTIPTDISENGQVVGYYYVCSAGPSRAFRWTAEGGFVTLALPQGFSEGSASGFDDQTGWIVGSTDGPGTDGPFATVWQNGQPLVLGTLPGGDYTFASESASGRVVGRWGNEITGDPGLQAFLWEGGVMVDLAPDLNRPFSRADAVNNAGQVTGSMGNAPVFDERAFIWAAGKVTELPPIPGGFTSSGKAIDARGRVVGYGRITDPETGDEVTRAFYWDGGQPINLGTLPGLPQSGASDLNDEGIIVGAAGGPGVQVATVWFDGVMVDLNSLIPPGAGVEILNAHAINNGGQIAAQAHDTYNLDVVGVLLTPIEVPLGDLTCDGSVSVEDFLLLLLSWGPCPPGGGCPADLNGDGAVGVVDFLLLLQHWG